MTFSIELIGFITLLSAIILAGSVAFSDAIPSPDLTVWVLVLLIQSLPYVAALIISLISAFPNLGAKKEMVVEPIAQA